MNTHGPPNNRRTLSDKMIKKNGSGCTTCATNDNGAGVHANVAAKIPHIQL